METAAIIIGLSLLYLADILLIILGIKTIKQTYREYYMPVNHESHIELNGIVSSVKYPGVGRYTTEYVEVEFEYDPLGTGLRAHKKPVGSLQPVFCYLK